MDATLAKAKKYGARVRRSGRRWVCALAKGAWAVGYGATPGEAITAALERAGVLP